MPLSVFTELWLPILVAVMIAAAALVLRRLIRGRRSRTEPSGAKITAVAAPLAIGSALVGMHLFAVGRPTGEFPGLTERLLPAFLVATLLGMLTALCSRLAWAGVFAFIASAISAVIAIWPMFTSTAQRPLALTLVSAVALAGAFSVVCLKALADRGYAVAGRVILAGLGLAVGGALLGAGNLKLGQFGLAVGVAACVLTVYPTGAAIASATLLGSGTTVFAILSTLALAANRYAFLKPIPPLIFFLVVPVALLVSLSRIPRVHARWIGVLCVVAAALVAGTATALSVDLRGTNESTGGTGDEYGYGP